MRKPKHFEMDDGVAVYRPRGKVTLDRAVEMVMSAISYSREQKISKLLVVASALTGFKSPSLVKRWFFICDWARASGGGVRLALVVRPEMIDPQKFGVTVAANRGMHSDVFSEEPPARAWIRR